MFRGIGSWALHQIEKLTDMNFESQKIADVFKITPRSFGDDRGEFMETFKSSLFQEKTGCDATFVQDNQSLSVSPFTVRGLHFQHPPFAQGKLVRCTQGEIIDVAVDIRKGSPTFGQHVSVHLTSENKAQLWVPEGFLHGFSTLVPNTIVQYKCTNYYSAECDGNVMWNDEKLGIDWGIDGEYAILSDKDKLAPTFAKFDSPFHF